MRRPSYFLQYFIPFDFRRGKFATNNRVRGTWRLQNASVSDKTAIWTPSGSEDGLWKILSVPLLFLT